MNQLPPLRLILTSSCPYNCPHCHREGLKHFRKDFPQSFLLQVIKSSSELGFSNIRLTGGEPTLRSDLKNIIEDIQSIGKFDVKLSTNGYNLVEQASELREAGLNNVSISLFSLRDNICRQFTGKFLKLDKAIDEAKNVGLHVNINTVLMKGINDCELSDIIEYASKKEIDLTFMTLIWVPEIETFYRHHYISDNNVLQLLFQEANNVSLIAKSAPKLLFKMPNDIRIFLKSKRFSKLIKYPMCNNCQYYKKCTEGFYAIRIDGSGYISPCLLSQFKIKLKENIDKEDIRIKLIRTLNYALGENNYNIDKNNIVINMNQLINNLKNIFYDVPVDIRYFLQQPKEIIY